MLDINFLFSDPSDLYPDNVNLGTFRKRLLIDVCFKVKSYNVKKEAVSKKYRLYHFPGPGGCTGSEIQSSKELEDLFGEMHKKWIKM